MVALGTRVCESVDSICVWGPDRTSAAVGAYAIASKSGRQIAWLDIRDPGVETEPYDELLTHLIPSDQRYLTKSPDELTPEIAASNLAVWTLVRSDNRGKDVMGLIDFLRLPDSVQTLIAELSPRNDDWVLLVTNADRLAPIYPEELASTRQYVDTITQLSVKLIATICGIERKDRFAYDYVFRIDRGPTADWPSSVVSVEKGELGPGRAGSTPTSMREIEEFASLVRAGDDRLFRRSGSR